jgi:predicted XRE-type DNA-binding protein
MNTIYGPQQLADQLKLFRTTNNLRQVQVAKRVAIKHAPISNAEK